MSKVVSGYCPTQDKEYSISVSYLNASTLEEKSYIKGTFRCEHNLYGDKCNGNECPIYDSAPQSI